MLRHWFKPLDFFDDLYDSLHTTISNREYNKLLNEMSGEDYYAYACAGKLYNLESHNILLLHIEDEQLGKNLYQALISGKSFPEDLDLMRFVSLKKQEKVVFIIYYNLSQAKTKRRGKDLESHLTSLINVTDSFLEFASIDENKIYINYTEMLHSFKYWESETSSKSLMRSITSVPVEEDVGGIITSLLGAFQNSSPFPNLYRETFLDTSNSYYFFLSKGVSLGSRRSSDIPASIFANIAKYYLDTSELKSPRQLFDLNESLEGINITTDTFIFDSDRFNRSLKFNRDCNEFVSFSLEDLTFLKLKDVSKKDLITNIIKGAGENDSNPLKKLDLIASDDNNVYLYVNTKGETACSLKDFCCQYNGSQAHLFMRLLESFINAFIDISKNKDLRFNENIDYLNCIFANDSYNFFFTDFGDLNLNKGSVSTSFDIDFAAIQMLNTYFSVNDYKFNDLDDFVSSFSRAIMLPPAFSVKLLDYINNGVYERSKKPILATGILSEACADKIQFIEDIVLNDTSSLEYTFFDDVNIDELAPNFASNLKQKPVIPHCLSLKDKLDCLPSRVLTSKCLEKLFDKEHYVLHVHKVIVSKNIIEDGKYKIIGVLWNFGSLVGIKTALKNKLIDTKQLYIFLADVMRLRGSANLELTKLLTTDSLYISLTSNDAAIVDPSVVNNQKTSARFQREKYYYKIISTLTSENLLDGYDVFDYDDLETPYSNFISEVLAMEPCPHHPGHWKLRSTNTCPLCKKIYLFVNTDLTSYRYDPLFTSNNTNFYNISSKLFCFCEEKYFKLVEMGISHDLYKGFVGPTPFKLATDKTHNQGLSPVCINCNDFSFKEAKLLTNFEHIQRLKVALALYDTLLPKIKDYSFIANDKGIFDSLIMHKDFKGVIIIPNLYMLDCEIILSDDEKLKQEKQAQTLQWFSEFLLEYISSDKNFTRDTAHAFEFKQIIDDITKCSFNPVFIKHYIELFSNFCSIHKVYFTDETICYKCLNDGISKEDMLFKPKKYFESLTGKSSTYDGGEANIYTYSNKQVQKIFKGCVDIKFKSKILAKSISKREQIKEFNKTHSDITIISADKLLYEFENKVVSLKGFTQEFVDGAFKISSLKKKEFVKEQKYTTADIVEILIKVCTGIEFIHSIGGYIGDLNGGNILIKGKHVYFIDIDGMSFDEVKNSVFTLSYIYPPSAENKNITADDDWYSFAVQAFYYLTHAHPFRGVSMVPLVSENEIERMKDHHSVLGIHGIEPPSVSIGWDFLPNYIIDFFLNTFEGSQRKNMSGELTRYLNELKKTKVVFKDVARQRKVLFNISEHTYIDDQFNLIYKEDVITVLPEDHTSYWNDNFVFISTSNISYLLNENTGELSEFDIGKSIVPLEMYKDLVFTKSSDDGVLVYQKKEGKVVSYSLPECKGTCPIEFSIQENGKFIFLYKIGYQFYISGNVAQITIPTNEIETEEISQTDILYDKASKKWLVTLSSDTKTIVVSVSSKNGNWSVNIFDKPVSRSKYFYKNTLYYVDEKQICYYNIVTHREKVIPCDIVEKSSLIKREDNVFVINNGSQVYLYQKS